MNREVADAARRLREAVDAIEADDNHIEGEGELQEAVDDLLGELRRLNLIPAAL